MRKYHRNQSAIPPLYDYESWQIKEKGFSIDNNHRNEAIFSLGNGYMGVRGTFEEDYSGPANTSTPGVYINGVYAAEQIIYGERTPKQPELSQTIVNLANWTKINLFLEQEKFDMLTGELIDYQRVLKLKEGVLTRHLVWRSPEGKEVEITISRSLSLPAPNLGLINYRVKALNFKGKISLVSMIDGNVKNHHHLRNPKVLKTRETGFARRVAYIIQEIASTGFTVGMAMINQLQDQAGNFISGIFSAPGDGVCQEFTFELEQGMEMNLNKYVACLATQHADSVQLSETIQLAVEQAVKKGYGQLLKEQGLYLKDFWSDADIRIEGDPASQQAFRFNIYHLLQSTGRDGLTNAAAKGLTGEFYEGHCFWDTETYIFPFFLYNKPEIARSLLLYRYHTLEQARLNARRVNLSGALFPWRTINGEEASSYFMGSTVQFHINADIAYAVKNYLAVTGDQQFLYDYGAEIIFETARMWADRGCFIELRDDQFCLNEVCGPDEYQPGVANNCYTNYLAKFNLEYALEVFSMLAEEVPEGLAVLKEKIDLAEDELQLWKKAAANMFLPYNRKLSIHPQDDSFLYKQTIDLDSIPVEEFPLVEHWHPLAIWRYQLIKQADVVLLMLLLGDRFSLAEKRSNYDYYEPRTTHDSSLSPAIYSIIASEIGYYQDAYNYFKQTARIDLDNYNQNTDQGVHLACMASTWMVLVQGFAGMRNYAGTLCFKPYLPCNWQGYQFKLKVKDSQLLLKVEGGYAFYQLLKGPAIEIEHDGQRLTVNTGGVKVLIGVK